MDRILPLKSALKLINMSRCEFFKRLKTDRELRAITKAYNSHGYWIKESDAWAYFEKQSVANREALCKK
jgi:hypothetical protein